jgi:uncharacterized membrane protein
VTFDNLPAGVTLKEVLIPADQTRVYVEATLGPEADVGEQEVKVTAAAGPTRAESALKVKVTKR